jgi:glycosyltransferase involved in cell wall biosynthesis
VRGSVRADLPRVLGVIPAQNESATLPGVVAELRARCPHLDILIVDDGSTDGSAGTIETLGTHRLRLRRRMGIGSAMRAGVRFARRLGYDGVVRVDGDGQHRADDVEALLAPIREGRADVVLGTRFAGASSGSRRPARVVQRALALCLSVLTGHHVTDPTSGFAALGPRAMRLLAEHHPTGYAEAELRLMLSRNGLDVVEVPVVARARLGGRSSLTPGRLTAASARVLMALLIVPLRGAVGEAGRD